MCWGCAECGGMCRLRVSGALPPPPPPPWGRVPAGTTPRVFDVDLARAQCAFFVLLCIAGVHFHAPLPQQACSCLTRGGAPSQTPRGVQPFQGL